jgi:hypothetical protein
MATSSYEGGERCDHWAQVALSYIPEGVLDDYAGHTTFMSMARADASRVARQYREGEIVVLSERIVPPEHADEGQEDVRYFIFAVLHEMVHVLSNHRPPNLITAAENDAQEEEADRQALDWFNGYVAERANPYLVPLRIEAVDVVRGRNQARMAR